MKHLMQQTKVNAALLLVLAGGLALAQAAVAQQAPNFSGRWVLNAKATPGVDSNEPEIAFPSYIVIKHGAGDLHWESSSTRQETVALDMKLGGPEVARPGADGMKYTARARLDGDKLLIDSTRSYPSPIGDITAEFAEVYTIAGNTMTVQRTEKVGGITSHGKAVYDKSKE
jgi:hypothetical protein